MQRESCQQKRGQNSQTIDPCYEQDEDNEFKIKESKTMKKIKEITTETTIMEAEIGIMKQKDKKRTRRRTSRNKITKTKTDRMETMNGEDRTNQEGMSNK